MFWGSLLTSAIAGLTGYITGISTAAANSVQGLQRGDEAPVTTTIPSPT